MVLQVPLKNQVGRLETETPRRGGWQVAYVHGKEVTPRGQHIQPTATRRTAGPCRDKAPTQGIEQAAHLRRPTGIQAWRDDNAQAFDHRLHLLPAGLFQLFDGAFQRLLDQARRVQLQTFAGIPGRTPQLIVNLLQHQRAPPRPGLGQCTIERIKPQVECLGQHTQQTRLRAPAIATGNAQQRQQGVDTQTALGRLAKDMQAIADLRFLQVAQVGIQARQPHRRVRLTAQFKLLVDTGFAHQLEDVFLQLQRTARVEQLRLVIFVGQ